MNRNQIIEQIAKDPVYRSMCRQLAVGCGDDLYQEMILILLAYPEDKLQVVYETNPKAFFWHVAKSQIMNKFSPFYVKHYKPKRIENKNWEEIQQVWDATCLDVDQELLSNIEKIMAGLDWFDASLLRLYAEEGSTRNVSALTSIPRTIVQASIASSKKIIKRKMSKINSL